MRLSAVSSYGDTQEPEQPETGLEIVKVDAGTNTPLAGAVFEVEFVRGPRLEDFQVIMEPSEEKIFTLDKSGSPLNTISFPEKFIVIPGIEGPGLPENLKIDTVSIPLSDNIESLNAAVALSIFLYQWRIKKNLTY
jgi:tRNA G18 (ribose-2'-O)-methylase SpoU